MLLKFKKNERILFEIFIIKFFKVGQKFRLKAFRLRSSA